VLRRAPCDDAFYRYFKHILRDIEALEKEWAAPLITAGKSFAF